MKKFILTEELGLKVLDYLGSRPYVEVFQLIHRLQTLEEILEEKKEEKKPQKEVIKKE